MKEKLHDYRKVYNKDQLLEEEVETNPFELFTTWFREIETRGEVEEVNAMTVSTVGLDEFPKSRIVLLKEYDQEGFVFYTNYDSVKGRSINNNPKICLSFFWPKAERQVIIKGVARKVPEEVSDAYFNARPKGSQLGAWASDQSRVISSREYLQEKLQALEKEYENKPVPRPPHWGGFKVYPREFEFWQGRPNRLHDRLYYSRLEDQSWTLDRLAP